MLGGGLKLPHPSQYATVKDTGCPINIFFFIQVLPAELYDRLCPGPGAGQRGHGWLFQVAHYIYTLLYFYLSRSLSLSLYFVTSKCYFKNNLFTNIALTFDSLSPYFLYFYLHLYLSLSLSLGVVMDGSFR